MDAPLLEVLGCRQAYHKEAKADLVVLEDVNLALREGEIVALLGRSGSGKLNVAGSNCFWDCCDRQPWPGHVAGYSRIHARQTGIAMESFRSFCAFSMADRAGKC